MNYLKEKIEEIWHTNNSKDLEWAQQVMELLDKGEIRAAEKINNDWIVNEWVKKGILMYFKYTTSGKMENAFDKVPLKFSQYEKEDYEEKKIRVIPGSVIRYGSFIEQNCVIMPSFINVGARVGAGTLIDSWSTVGSCAQVGKNCHISGGVGIGGVLEPVQASPVIIEDNVFIGARSEIAEGVIVKEGAVISMGVYIGASTKIYNRETKEISYGTVPSYSVVVPGTLPSADNSHSTYSAIIVKQVDEKTRSKITINELLRI